jgi:Carboxypeptidase regulatory-like domain/FG-GAP repeat
MGAADGVWGTVGDAQALEPIAPWPGAGSRSLTLATCALLGSVLGALALALSSHGVGVRTMPAHGRPTAFGTPELSGLPVAAQGVVSSALGADGSAFRAHASAHGFRASNPAQDMQASFGRGGVQIEAGGLRVGLRFAGIGFGDLLAAVHATAPTAARNRVSFRRDGYTEWYANGPLGLEQGFTIERRPHGTVSRPLKLAIAVSGNAHVSLGRHGGAAYLRHGRDLLRYTGLSVTDANGRALRSWFAMRAGGILLEADAARAAYPLRVDPLVQQGSKLTGTAKVWRGNVGVSVALSTDGNTALVGAPQDEYSGAAYVFTRSGSTWTEQAKLTPAGEKGASIGFGAAVALSADGSTALVGAPGYGARLGAAWAFTRSGTAWSEQQKLTGGAAESEGQFGTSLALSADGDTALVGSPDEYRVIRSKGVYGAGAVYPFVRTGSSWAPQGERLTGTEEVYPEQYAVINGSGFGDSIALSADGNTAVVGGPRDDEYRGAVWSFTRSGKAWTQHGKKLTAQARGFGESVAMSADGSTALIGAPPQNGFAGAAWVLTQTGSEWSKQAELKGAPGEFANFGSSTALSGNGNTALIGSPTEQNYVGAAWLFSRTGTVWSGQCEHLTASGEVGEGRFGAGAALSSDADTALIGAPLDQEGSGAAWVLVATPPGTGAARPAATIVPSCAAGAPEPTVETLGASEIAGTSATVSATVDPNGGDVKDCHFEYGTTLEYGASVPCRSLPGAGTAPVSASATLSALSPFVTYHYRIVATNEGGTSTGEDRTFATREGGTGIAGTVTSASTGLPIGGIEVCAYEEAGESPVGECTSSESSGRYALTGLTGGAYIVEFSSPASGASGYIRQYYDDKSQPEEAEAVTVSAGSVTLGIDAQLKDGGRVAGKVTSAASHTAVSGVLVCAFTAALEIEECGLTNGTGEYAITGLPSGSYRIGFDGEEAGYVIQYYDDQSSLSTATPVTVTTGGDISGINAQLTDGGRITGTVTSATTGAPVPGVLVCAFVSAGEIEECAVTDATGDYTIAGLPTGVYEVGFSGGKAYGIQFYSGASSFAGARPVSVTTGSTDGSIDAALRPVGTLSPPPVWAPPIGIGAAAGSGSAGAAGGSASAGAAVGVLGTTATRNLAVEIGALLRRALTPAGRAARLASLLAGGGYTVAFRALSAGTAAIDWYQIPPRGKLARKTRARPVLVASGRMQFSATGTARIKVGLTREGRRLIKRDKTVKLTATGTFTPSGGKPIRAIEQFVLKR